MKLGFVHIPKTGGHCIEEVIKKYYVNDFLKPSYGHKQTTSDYPYSFAIVREPVERFLSSYYYWQNGAIDGSWQRKSNWNPKAKTLDEFIYYWDKKDPTFFYQLDTEFTKPHHHFAPQAKWVNANLENTIILKYSGDIDIQFTKLLDFLNVGKQTNIPFKNITKDKKTEIDDKILKWIHDTYIYDFKLWEAILEEKNIFYKIII